MDTTENNAILTASTPISHVMLGNSEKIYINHSKNKYTMECLSRCSEKFVGKDTGVILLNSISNRIYLAIDYIITIEPPNI